MGTSSTNSSSRVIYGNTTTKNPYVTSKTTNSGTKVNFNAGTAFDTINKFVNSNMENLLDEYLNPTLSSTTNQAKLNAFRNTLENETVRNFENNIVNQLSNRNMVRSSQATNLYNNLVNSNANAIGNFTNELLANSQKNTGEILGKLLDAYMSGHDVISSAQNHSLSASKGNATKNEQKTSFSANVSDLARLMSSLTNLGL